VDPAAAAAVFPKLKVGFGAGVLCPAALALLVPNEKPPEGAAVVLLEDAAFPNEKPPVAGAATSNGGTISWRIRVGILCNLPGFAGLFVVPNPPNPPFAAGFPKLKPDDEDELPKGEAAA
jgi:hypothetical protein